MASGVLVVVALLDCAQKGLAQGVVVGGLVAGSPDEVLEGGGVLDLYFGRERVGELEEFGYGFEVGALGADTRGEGEVEEEVEPGAAVGEDEGALAHGGVVRGAAILGDHEGAAPRGVVDEFGEIEEVEVAVLVGDGGGDFHRVEESWPRPAFLRAHSRGQKRVKEDWRRLRPTKAVNQSQRGLW